MGLVIDSIGIEFRGELEDGFEEGFRSLFARRYLPSVGEGLGKPDIVLERFKGESFRIFSSSYDHGGIDHYRLESPLPSAYGNEGPVFFLLQAAARAGLKKGRIFVTDSVSVVAGGSAVLFVGYPHTGKSTVSALAISKGLPVLSTENTVVEVRERGIYVVGGTDVLVYDPRIEGVYDVKLDYDETTRSGYRIKDLGALDERGKLLKRGVRIGMMVVLHSAFNCMEASFSRIKGRKVRKALWYFSTALMKGLDYYEPYPLHMPMNDTILKNLSVFLERASEDYSDRMFEAFGNHRAVFERVIEMALSEGV
ncbi:hypothetical protein [Thermococcus sp.]